MFGLGKKKSEDSKSDEVQNSDASDSGIFTRLKNGLSRTRSKLSDGLAEIVLGEKTIDLNLLEDIETQLLSADVGIDATDQIVNNLKQQLGRKQLAEPEQFMAALRQELTNILKAVDTPLGYSVRGKALRNTHGRRQWRRKDYLYWQTCEAVSVSRNERHAGRWRYL